MRCGSAPSMALRMAYQGRTQEALAIVEEVRASEAVKNSGQASRGSRGADRRDRLPRGSLGRRVRDRPARLGHQRGPVEFALRCRRSLRRPPADLDRTNAVNEAMSVNLVNEFPMTRSRSRQMGATFKAFSRAAGTTLGSSSWPRRGTLDGMQRFRAKALFQLAVAHLAGDRFPEAAERPARGRGFFEERGAGWLSAGYREKAVRPPDQGRDAGQAPGAASGQTVEAEHPRRHAPMDGGGRATAGELRCRRRGVRPVHGPVLRSRSRRRWRISRACARASACSMSAVGPGALTAELVRRVGAANVVARRPVGAVRRGRAPRATRAIAALRASAEDLPFADGSFDATPRPARRPFHERPGRGPGGDGARRRGGRRGRGLRLGSRRRTRRR